MAHFTDGKIEAQGEQPGNFVLFFIEAAWHSKRHCIVVAGSMGSGESTRVLSPFASCVTLA